MSVGSNTVKVTAKTALKGNYLRLVASCLIFLFVWALCYNFSAILMPIMGTSGFIITFCLLLLLIVLPIGLGLLRSIWRMLFGVYDNPVSVFYWFSERKLYLRAVKLVWQFVYRIAIWLAILNIPSVILYFFSRSFFFEMINVEAPVWTANFGYFSLILRNVSYVLIFFIMLKFYIAPILVIADENMDVSEAMYTSAVISKKSAVDFMGLIVSCVLWLICSLFLMPLPFTLPFLLSFYAVHTRFAVAEYNLHITGKNARQEGFT